MPSVPEPILFYSYGFRPCIHSGVQRTHRLTKYLPEFGYRPYVICSSEFGTLPEPDVAYVPNAATEPIAAKAARRAAQFQRWVLPYDEYLPYVPHAVAAGAQFIEKNGAVAILSTAPPQSPHIAALRMKQRSGLKWIADFRDPLVGNPGRDRKWARFYDAALERWILSNCDAAIAVTDVVFEQWKKRYPKWNHKFHLIWNGYDPEEPVQAEPIPARPFKVLTHAGAIYRLRHPYWLAESFHRLIENGRLSPEAARIRLIGPIVDERVFRSNPSVRVLREKGCLEYNGKQVPRLEANHAAATSDYLLIIDITNLDNTGYTVPAKLYDYVRIGRPILTYTPSDDSPTPRILKNSGIPYAMVHPGEPDDKTDATIAEFLRLSSEPAPPSEWFLEMFDGKRQAQAVAALIRETRGTLPRG